jgi:Tape measure protein/Domain of unknown function (DUF4214)
MAYELAKLRTEAELDASQYIREANDAAAAAGKLGRAADQMGEQVQQTDVKMRGSTLTLETLQKRIDPTVNSTRRLKEGIEVLNAAFADGKNPQEHARLMELLHDRYDKVGQAAKRAAAQEAEAAVARARAAAKAAAEAEEAQRRQVSELSNLRAKYDDGYSAIVKYNTALEELARLEREGVLAGQSLAQAQAKVEAELNPTNVALNKQQAELRQLTDRLDPAAAASRKLAKDTETLADAFKAGRISGVEYERMLRLLNDRHKDAADGAVKTGGALRGVLSSAANEATSRLGLAGEALSAVGASGTGAVVGITAAVVTIAALTAASIPAASEFQNLTASLRTVSGSAQLAAAQFEVIKQFALDTPLSVDEVTKSFVKLKAMGLDPSMEAIRSYGNTASVMSKSVEQFVDAIADAVMGEFGRLPEFAIKAKAEGDKVTFIFNNVKTTVGNNAKEIQQYLQSIGNVQFGTGMAEKAATFSGAVETLSDNWKIFLANIGESGPIQAATALVNALADAISGLNTLLFPSIEKQIADTTAMVKVLRDELAEMRQNPDAYSAEIKGREAILRQEEQILAALQKEKAERDKLIATANKQKDAEKELSEEEKKAREKAAEAAKREAERRQGVTDKLDIEWDERNRMLEAVKEGALAVEKLNRELAGEKAIREFLGVTNNKAMHQMMQANPALAEQARKVQEVARANHDLKVETDKLTDAQKENAAARKKALEEAAREQEKYIEEIARTSEKISQDVAENLYDTMMDPDKATSILDFFKSLFKRIAVEAVAANVILPITSQVVGSMPGLFGISAPGKGGKANTGGFVGAAGNLATMGGMYPGAQAPTMQFLNTPIWGSTSAGTEKLIQQTGSTAAAYDTPQNIAQGSGVAQSGPTWGQAGQGLAGGMAGGAVGAAVGQATQSRAKGALAGAAAGALAGAPGGWVGAAVGAVVGGITGALGSGGKQGNMEGNATYSLGSGRTVIGGQTGDKFSQQNRDAAQNLAEGLGEVGRALGRYSGRDLQSSLRVVVGSRDGLEATVNGKTAKGAAGETGKLGQFVINQFAAELGDSLPKEIASALARTDWSNLENALNDISFGADFQASIKALGEDMGLVDAATQAAKEEVRFLTDEMMGFRETAARLGLDTAAANDATRRYIEGLLGMREVEAPMTDVEKAVSIARVRFAEIVPLLQALGINADEAAKALDRTIKAMRDDFIGGLDKEFNDLSGKGWINQIDATFAIFTERMRNAAALGGGDAQAMRNNHAAIVKILEGLSDEHLTEAAQRYGGNITVIAESIKAARAAVQEGAPVIRDGLAVIGEAVFDVAAWLKGLEREANETSGRNYINAISDQFAKMNTQLAEAAKAGMGADIVLANNHRAMTNLLNGLNDAQLGDAARTFGGGIDVIAQAILAARAAAAQAGVVAGAVFDVAGWLSGLGRSINQLQGNGYIDAVTDQFAKMTEGLRIAAREGTGSQEVLTENHLAMVAILRDLTDEQLAAAAARFGGGIKAIADSLIAGRRATEAATAAQEAAAAAAQKAKEQAEALAAATLEAANDRVERARQAVQDSYAREIDAQNELAEAAQAAGDRMRGFASGFKALRQSLLTGDLSPLSPVDRYNTARSEFQQVAGRAAAGDADAMEKLEAASQNFLQQSRAYYASSATYTADFNMVTAALSQAEASASQQASAADQQLAAAKAQTALLQSQLDAIFGTTAAVLTIPAAMQELTAALLAQAQAGGGTGQTTNGVDLITAAYRQYLGRDPEAAGYTNWQNAMQGGMSIGDVVNGIANSAEAKARAAGSQNGTMALLSAVNRVAATPANDPGVKVLTNATLHQTAALQDGLAQLIKLTAQQGQDIAELRAAERRRAAA